MSNRPTNDNEDLPGDPQWPDWIRRLYADCAPAFEGFIEVGFDWIEETDSEGPSSYDFRIYQHLTEVKGKEGIDDSVRVDVLVLMEALDEVDGAYLQRSTEDDDETGSSIVVIDGTVAGHSVTLHAYRGAPGDARATRRLVEGPDGSFGFEPITEN